MRRKEIFAFGWPGIEARWTSSDKSGVGTACTSGSKVWYSINHGILNEIYYPQVDQACTRDMGFIVTDGKDFFSDEKRDAIHKIRTFAKGVPGYLVTSTCKQNYYRIEKEILTDPERDSLIQRVRFIPSKKKKNLMLFIILAPHIGNSGRGNTAWVGAYKGVSMLFAHGNGSSLALACSVPWKKKSAGFVGASDGWQDLKMHRNMHWEFATAENGNVALAAEIDLEQVGNSSFVLALGFGRNPEEAGQRSRASILGDFEKLKYIFNSEWLDWHKKLYSFNGKNTSFNPRFFSISAAMLRTHESKRHPGGLIASLSIPWGFSKGDEDLGGYHLVWPRDLVQTAGGLLAAGAHDDARRVLTYLMVTQEDDGHWVQNMWLDGRPYWKGVQMDQTALPVMLLDLVNRETLLSDEDLRHFWPMIRKAASYLAMNGPVTHQDRWEENAGYSTFTIAVEISALLIAADYAEHFNEPAVAAFLRETADSWNSCVERWTYVKGSDLANFVGVEGYYVRINSQESIDSGKDLLVISNRPGGENICPASEMVSPDALALVRFGLRKADDPKILNTIKVIDATLRMDHSSGPVWYRYNRDGYGEQIDGKPFNFVGVGRPWPLLTGERGHYEVAACNYNYAEQLAQTMENYANDCGLIPEQVWDSDDIPSAGLFFGKPSGSAMPLVWAHAEYIKLCRSIKAGRIFDMPAQTERRYLIEKVSSDTVIWDFNTKSRSMLHGNKLRIHTRATAMIRWTFDKWKTFSDTSTTDSGIGVHYADLPSGGLEHGREIEFTFYWPDSENWEGANYQIKTVTEKGNARMNGHAGEVPDRDSIKIFFPS